MKRFWTDATAEPDGGGWSVKLDGKPMRLPGGQALKIATRPLAEALAAEWAAAGDGPGGTMDYSDVPLTRLAGTAQERVAAVADGVVAELARYGENDLLCYRALEPPELVAAEAAAWDPWIDWAAASYGARLTVVQGIVAVRQPDAAIDALTGAVAACDVNTLAGLGVIVPALGSLGTRPGARGRGDHGRRRPRDVHRRRTVPGRVVGRGRRGDCGTPVGRARRGRRGPVHRVGEGTMTARRIIISGRVQGLGYRDWLVAEARRLALSGWVRNRRDGTVEALIDGAPAAIEEALRLCRRGPVLAEVSEIVEELAEPPDEPGFSRRPTV